MQFKIGDLVKIKNTGNYFVRSDDMSIDPYLLDPYPLHGIADEVNVEGEIVGIVSGGYAVKWKTGGYAVKWKTVSANNCEYMCLDFKEDNLELVTSTAPEIIKENKTLHMTSRFITTENHDLLEACIEQNQPALLIGETGTGKTTLIREVAKEKKQTLHRVSVNGTMGVEEILGKFLVKNGTTYWQDGILTTAMKKGHWIVFDEINAALPEILFTLHSLLDDDRKILLPEKDNEIVIPHADFRFFATMNPPEEYAGTKDMNKALMSRFTAVLIVEVLSQQDEYKLLVDEKKADPKTAETLVRIATALRDEKVKENIFYFCSTRDLVQCAFLVNNGLTLDVAVKGSIINKMSLAEYEVVKKHFANIISKIESRGKSFPDIEKEWASSQTTIDSLNVQIRELTSAKDGIKSETIKKILESVETI